MDRILKLFFILLFATAIYCESLGQQAFAVSNSYFDMRENESADLKAFTKWTGMVSRFNLQKKVGDNVCDQIRYHPCKIVGWKSFIQSIKQKSLDEQIELVNDWGNEHPYIEDQVNWGIDDYWETPYEFMEVSGDCEDYAIAKYYSLRALGVPAEKMRVIVLQDNNLGGIIHAVLGVYNSEDELMILDNQSKQVSPALRIYHYRPIYGINEQAWWAYYPNNS